MGKMFTPEYCCCAIPLVNAGIYTLLTEQFVIGILAGVLTLATPDIVGSFVPSFTPYIFAAFCFIVAAIQVMGFMGVFKEKTSVFKTYSLINAAATLALFIVAGVLIGISASKHDAAVTACEKAYFAAVGTASNTTTATVSEQGQTLCKAFAWADVGIMGGLWLIMAIVQGYLIFITRSYGREQKEDHQRYKSIYSTNAEEFALADRNSRFNAEAWDARPSFDENDADYHHPSSSSQHPLRDSIAYGPPGAHSYPQHDRSDSSSSIPGYDHPPPNPYASNGQNPFHEDGQRYADEQMYGGGGMGYPEQAVRGRDPGATPTMQGYSDEQAYADGGLRRPEEGRMHPAEGMFGRKSPRF